MSSRRFDKREALEESTGTAFLGMLADDVLIALSKVEQGKVLDPRERATVEEARTVVYATTRHDKRSTQTDSLRRIAPRGSLGRAFGAIRTAGSDNDDDESATLDRVVECLDSILSGSRESEDIEIATHFFRRLADVTLTRARELVRPRHDGRMGWTAKLSRS